MFDYENIAGQAFIKDKRLKSYEWTDTGIKLTIKDLDKNMDLGKYQGDVSKELNQAQTKIEVKKIFGKSFICLDYLEENKNKL